MKPTPETLWRRARKACIGRDGAVCRICGKGDLSGHGLHVDHVYPIKTHPHLRYQLHNLQVLCAECNVLKNAQDPIQFLQSRIANDFEIAVENFLGGLERAVEQESLEKPPAVHHNVPPELVFLDETQLSKWLGISARTLQAHRHRGGGIPFVRMSTRCVRYKKSDVLEWLAKRQSRSTSDKGER